MDHKWYIFDEIVKFVSTKYAYKRVSSNVERQSQLRRCNIINPYFILSCTLPCGKHILYMLLYMLSLLFRYF